MEELQEMTDDERIQRLFDVEIINSLVNGRYQERAQNAIKLWKLYTLCLWIQESDVTISGRA